MEAPNRLKVWAAGGTLVAATFAVWLLLFPDLVAPYFAWPAEPRLGQVFIGAGFIFRTAFFFSVLREATWRRIAWIYWGNLAFTGALLLATFLHAEAFNWGFPTALIWLILYVIEPVLMIYQAPGREERAAEPGVIPYALRPELKWVLVAEAGLLGTIGAMLVLNPAFMSAIWPWAFRPLGGRIIAAWFLGWAVWAGTMAVSQDWDAIRTGVRLNILFGLALLATLVIFALLFDWGRPGTPWYAVGVVVLPLALIVGYWRQERATRTTPRLVQPRQA